jgi:hypothetical protein
MREPTERQNQLYQRLTEICEIGKQRCVEAVGDSKGYRAGVRDMDYLTDEERQEAKLLLRQMFDTSAKDHYLKKSAAKVTR